MTNKTFKIKTKFVSIFCIVLYIFSYNLFIPIINADSILINAPPIGIEGDILKWNSSNRDYEWYFDQANSGAYSNGNCGSAVATMAVKWSNKDFTKTVQDARNKYMLNGEWWSTDTVSTYINENNGDCSIKKFTNNIDDTKSLIDSGKIAILCINTYGLSGIYDYNSRVGRFYSPSNGHFILLKGYIETTKGFYLEFYDPFSMGQTDSDGSLKGKDRYYTVQDIDNALKPEWKYAIIINPKENNMEDFNKLLNGTVLIGNKVFSLDYANNPLHAEEINKEIGLGEKIFIKGFDGVWIENSNGNIVGLGYIKSTVKGNLIYKDVNDIKK
jgi:hypothetical protein